MDLHGRRFGRYDMGDSDVRDDQKNGNMGLDDHYFVNEIHDCEMEVISSR